jgi:hypothetical protein
VSDTTGAAISTNAGSQKNKILNLGMLLTSFVITAIKFWQYQNSIIFACIKIHKPKSENSGVRKQRQENGKRVQQAH